MSYAVCNLFDTRFFYCTTLCGIFSGGNAYIMDLWKENSDPFVQAVCLFFFIGCVLCVQVAKQFMSSRELSTTYENSTFVANITQHESMSPTSTNTTNPIQFSKWCWKCVFYSWGFLHSWYHCADNKLASLWLQVESSVARHRKGVPVSIFAKVSVWRTQQMLYFYCSFVLVSIFISWICKWWDISCFWNFFHCSLSGVDYKRCQ